MGHTSFFASVISLRLVQQCFRGLQLERGSIGSGLCKKLGVTILTTEAPEYATIATPVHHHGLQKHRPPTNVLRRTSRGDALSSHRSSVQTTVRTDGMAVHTRAKQRDNNRQWLSGLLLPYGSCLIASERVVVLCTRVNYHCCHCCRC